MAQVPLVVFKREKEISRSLEFDGMWIAEQPSDDDLKGHWDKLVISTGSFPDKYWDKFVKKKVLLSLSQHSLGGGTARPVGLHARLCHAWTWHH